MSAGADPEFMETCSNLHRGFVLLCLQLSCLKIAHEKEIILIHRGLRANPLTPSGSATITQTCPCNILQYFTARKMIIFR